MKRTSRWKSPVCQTCFVELANLFPARSRRGPLPGPRRPLPAPPRPGPPVAAQPRNTAPLTATAPGLGRAGAPPPAGKRPGPAALLTFSTARARPASPRLRPLPRTEAGCGAGGRSGGHSGSASCRSPPPPHRATEPSGGTAAAAALGDPTVGATAGTGRGGRVPPVCCGVGASGPRGAVGRAGVPGVRGSLCPPGRGGRSRGASG